MARMAVSEIGIIRTPFFEAHGTPIQPGRAEGARGTAEVYDEFKEGLSDLDGFSHVILIYWCHRCKGFNLKVVPYLDDQPRGVFATRAPSRPNPIGLSVVRLLSITGTTMHFAGADMLDGTPLLDIKPYVPVFDDAPDSRIGWLEGKIDKSRTTRADDRFHKDAPSEGMITRDQRERDP